MNHIQKMSIVLALAGAIAGCGGGGGGSSTPGAPNTAGVTVDRSTNTFSVSTTADGRTRTFRQRTEEWVGDGVTDYGARDNLRGSGTAFQADQKAFLVVWLEETTVPGTAADGLFTTTYALADAANKPVDLASKTYTNVWRPMNGANPITGKMTLTVTVTSKAPWPAFPAIVLTSTIFISPYEVRMAQFVDATHSYPLTQVGRYWRGNAAMALTYSTANVGGAPIAFGDVAWRFYKADNTAVDPANVLGGEGGTAIVAHTFPAGVTYIEASFTPTGGTKQWTRTVVQLDEARSRQAYPTGAALPAPRPPTTR